MADRQDIDALLIGALYGELEGDERERLEAHLASHPGDRAALEDMKATRAMFRDANLATALGSAEPAPAISAKLLQEAARRAPAKAAAAGGIFGWFAGLFRPFAAHPALASAAALVVVGGAASVMYANGRFRAEQPERTPPRAAETAAAPAGSAAAAPTPDLPMVGAGTGSSYSVALDDTEGAADSGVTARMAAALAEHERATAEGELRVARERAQAASAKEVALKAEPSGDDGLAGFTTPTPPRGAAKDAPAKKSTATATIADGRKNEAAKGKAAAPTGYLEIDKAGGDELQVRDLDGKLVESQVARGGGGATSGAGRPGAVAPRPESTAVAPAAPPPPPAAVTQKPDVGRAPAYDASADAERTAWARDQHARMVRLVAAGKCNDAGVVGAEIARKAPEYYQANVSNDRAVRACRSYVERARRAKQQEEMKSRASRSNDARLDAAESPSPSPSSK